MSIKYTDYYFDDIDADIKTIKYFNEFALGSAGLVATGAVLGGGLVGLYRNYRLKLNSCKNIMDPATNDKCQIGVIDSTISELKNRIPVCESNVNPAACKLKLMNKIEELQNRRTLFMKNMYRMTQIKNNKIK